MPHSRFSVYMSLASFLCLTAAASIFSAGCQTARFTVSDIPSSAFSSDQSAFETESDDLPLLSISDSPSDPSIASTAVEDMNSTILSGNLRKEAYALVSSAENSTIDYENEYGYIEDIGDGRGYTAGIIGFTSATGDLLDVIELYSAIEPDNPLAPFIPALKACLHTDSHTGLGNPFVRAWKNAAKSKAMRKAQNEIVNREYLEPAVKAALEDGLGPLGQYIYYDAMVVHGPGDDPDSFQGIRSAACEKLAVPSKGGSEAAYLNAFLDVRSHVMKKEAAHSDLSRINAQRRFIQEQNFNLSLPLHWTMYGDHFTLTSKTVEDLPEAD